jgi:hypothetical protein
MIGGGGAEASLPLSFLLARLRVSEHIRAIDRQLRRLRWLEEGRGKGKAR